MIDVPLAEVLRHLQPGALRRRPDQRTIYVPDTGYSLFGDSTNPYAIAAEDESLPQILDLSRELSVEAPEEAPRVLKMDDGLREHFDNVSASQSATAPTASPSELKLEATASGPSVIAPPAPAPIPKPEGPTLHLKVAPMATNWPDEIRAEIEALDPETIVTLPLVEVGASLAKGRVIFSWAQIRAWLEPASLETSAGADNTALSLPLKIVAPAYLAAAKAPPAERKTVAMDASIPALFSNSRESETTQPVPAEIEAAEPVSEAVPESEAVAPPESYREPETIGDVFGQPQKRDWTPTELVAGLVTLPGVAGAIVALQEGLPVAASLPEGVKSEVVAAFLPQIFARLNQYSGEMKLGEVDDMLFTTHGAHCQIYRLGYVYLAVLGKPGESLPWAELRLISGELARQTHK
jgi:predicted regulator of Ras-like GTPase activity (Roadblock/LC7/MglB family)